MIAGSALPKERALQALPRGLDLDKVQMLTPSTTIPSIRARERAKHLVAMNIIAKINDAFFMA